MIIIKSADSTFNVDGKLVGTLEETIKSVEEATVVYHASQSTLTHAQEIHDAVANYVEPILPDQPAK